MDTQLRSFLINTIARSEAVLIDAEKRSLHNPTVEFFRGQKVLAEQVLSQASFGLWLSWKSLAIIAVGGIVVWLLH